MMYFLKYLSLPIPSIIPSNRELVEGHSTILGSFATGLGGGPGAPEVYPF